MLETILTYLNAKKLNYKLVGIGTSQQVLLDYCPFCLDAGKNHFYISATTGQFYCHKCGKGGSLLSLKQHLGDTARVIAPFKTTQEVSLPPETLELIERGHAQLYREPDVALYLTSRGISTKTIKHFRLGVHKRNGTKYLIIPYFYRNTLMNVKYRSIPPAPKAYFREKGGLSILFNQDAIDQHSDTLYITEGEIDAMSLWDKGFQNVISVPNGAQGIQPEWVDLLDKYQKLIIVFDNDESGINGASKLASRLGLERCVYVTLPSDCKDINEFFMKGYTSDDFKTLVNSAHPFDVQHVQSVAGVIRDIIRSSASDNNMKFQLPWPSVNKLMNGLTGGDLVIIGGKPGIGKTTFTLNILYHFAIQHIPVLLFSLEMSPRRIVPRIIARHKRIDSRLCEQLDILTEAMTELANIPFYIAYKYNRPTWEFISDTIRQCVRRYGVQLVVFDNLHFLCRSLSRQTEEVSVNIQNFKLLAEELSIPIIVIARPRKTAHKVISGEDLKDSADIEGDADIIIVLARDRKVATGEEVEGTFEPKTLVVIDKCRYSSGGATHLWAVDHEARFDSIE